MEHNKAFGLVIKKLRLRQKLSQESLGFEVALDRSYISLLENGKKSATLNTIVKLAKAFNITPSQMVHQSEEIAKNG